MSKNYFTSKIKIITTQRTSSLAIAGIFFFSMKHRITEVMTGKSGKIVDTRYFAILQNVDKKPKNG